LLKCFPQNFYLLRLPAAIFAALGIVVLIFTYGRIFHNWNTALLLGVITACFPLHLIFSRLAWDPTFLFLWTPILLYLSLRLVTAPRRRDFWLMAICIPLALWTHATAMVFILAMLGALCWVQRDTAATWWRTHLTKPLGRIMPRSGTIFFGVCVAITAILLCLGRLILVSKIPLLINLAPAITLKTLLAPQSLVPHLRLLGDMLTSYRGLAYVAGYPDSPTFQAIGWIAELLLIFCWIRLALSRNSADRFLASLLLIYFLLIILSAGFLRLQIAGNQRYLIPMMVLLPVIAVRAFPHPIWLLTISVVMLGEYWICFEKPTLECRYIVNTEFTFRTGLREPKAEAAKLILHLSQPAAKPSPVAYTDLYWLQQPLQFLLFDKIDVHNGWPGPEHLHPGDFIIGYAGEPFLDIASAELTTASRQYYSYMITNQSGVQQVVILQIVK
jgi:hypothetical protein